MIAHSGGLGWDELVFLGVVAVLLFFLLARSRSRSGTDGSDQGRPQPPLRCAYCGARLGADDTTCPACGFRVRPVDAGDGGPG